MFDGHIIGVTDMSLDGFLWAPYEYFQQPLSEEEERELRGSHRSYVVAMKALDDGCADAQDSDEEWDEGFRRIDCLGEGRWLG